MAAASTGMEKSEMRALLKKAAPDHPVNFAFGQGKESGVALLKMDRTKNPKACGKMLEDEFKEAKNTRWGTCIINENDGALVRFVVNRAVSGMAKRLAKTLKGTGFTKVEIALEDGTLVEGASDDEQDGGEGSPAEAVVPEVAAEPAAAVDPHLNGVLAGLMKRIPEAIKADPGAKDRLINLAGAANAALKSAHPGAGAAVAALAGALDGGSAPATEGAAAETGPGENDAAAATKALAALLKQIPAATTEHPEAKGELLKLANAANTALKAQNLGEAESAIEALRGRLQQVSQPEPAAAPRAAKHDVGKRLLLQWRNAETEAETQLDAFVAAVLADPEVKSDPNFDEVQANLADAAALLPEFDGALEEELDRLDTAADDGSRQRALEAARTALKAYEAELSAAAPLRGLQSVSDEKYGIDFYSALQATLQIIGRDLAAA